MIMTLCTLLIMATNAQSDKYFSAMTARLSQLDTTRTVQGFNELAHTFERIGEAEKHNGTPIIMPLWLM